MDTRLFILKKKNKFMINIFEDAKFGDIFVDADGREMKFVMYNELGAKLLEGDKSTKQWLWRYNLDGTDAFGEVKIWRKGNLLTKEYLLKKGFLREFDELLNLENFVSPNKQITVWRNRDNAPSLYGWYAIINKDGHTRGTLDLAYVDQFETFLKLCGVEL